MDKIKFIAKSKLVLNTLRVCWKNPKDSYNCCECEKCFRTMLCLYAVGTLDKCKSFPKPINKTKLENLFLYPNWMRYFRRALNEIKKTEDPENLAVSIERCLERNNNRYSVRQTLSKLKDSFGNWDIKHTGGTFSRLYNKLSLI